MLKRAEIGAKRSDRNAIFDAGVQGHDQKDRGRSEGHRHRLRDDHRPI
jgi:hypothetical protein